jgi:type IV secretion system protein VirD4
MRSDEGSQPAAIAFLALIGLVMSAAIGAVAVLFKAHLLNAHTPWRKVPAALWALKGYPIVYQRSTLGAHQRG